ncbi:TPA: phage tail fiber protein [Klebsiella pneumoniae]
MTVSTQVSRNEYTGNGATTQYDFTFRILDKSHLLVQTLDTSESILTLTLGTDYTVTGVNRYSGGKVVLTSALPDGYKISIERSTPVTQEASIRNQGGFFPEIHEDAFDKLTMLVQQAYGWWSGLSLRKPSWLANYYDALNNRIRNLRDPSQAQDAATKNYVDENVASSSAYASSLFKRSLRVPENETPEYASTSIRSNMLVGCNDLGHFVPISGQTSTADLAFKLAASTGAELVGYRYGTTFEVLNRMKTYSDYAMEAPVDGYDSTFYTKVFADKNSDNDLYLPGKLNIAADLFGTSNNAAALSILGNNDNSFRNQVVGGDTAALSNYGIVEDVLVYLGLSGRAAIKTTNPIYTVNSITITDGADISKVKRGSIIKTSDLYFGKVVSLEGNVITVKEWRKKGVVGTPSGDTSYLNHIDKSYLANKVLWIPSSYTGTKAVGEEWDFYIASSAVTEKNGLDMVVHPSSIYGMDAAMLVRSAKEGVSWNTAVRATGCAYAGFVSADGDSGINASQASFYDMSTNAVGLRFNGNNAVHSIYWRYPNSSVYPASINPYGFRRAGGKITANAVSGAPVTLNNAAYNVINPAPFNIILPSTNLVAGQEIDFYMTSVGAITVTCASSSVNVNGSPSYSYTPSKTFSRGIARWDGSGWAFNS